MFELPRAFWHLPSAVLLQQLGMTSQGLTSAEARQRLSHFGPNALKPRQRATTLTLFLAQFKSPIILLLLVAAGLSFFLHDQADAIIILMIILISAGLGFWQEHSAANAVARLLAMVQRR